MKDHSNPIREETCERLQVPSDLFTSATPRTALTENVTTAASDCQPSCKQPLKLADKAHEDSILEEAHIIEVFNFFFPFLVSIAIFGVCSVN